MRATTAPIVYRSHALRRCCIRLAGLLLTLLVLSVAGCTGIPGSGGGQPTSAGLAQPKPLAWQKVALPPGFPFVSALQRADTMLAVAPSDGDTAYACDGAASAHAGTAVAWVTRDRGAHWTRTAEMRVPAGANKCFTGVDALDAATAVAEVSWSPSLETPDITQSVEYLTTDYGKTWQPLTGSQPFLVAQLATRAGVTIAVLATPTADGSIRNELVASSDHLRTYHRIDQPIAAAGDEVHAFWLNPTTGELLAQGSLFWRSSDAGQHWTRLKSAPVADNFVVQRPVARAWQICGLSYGDSLNAGPTNSIQCSGDSGSTWNSRSGLNLTTQATSGPTTAPADMFAIAANGDLLSAVQTGTVDTLYRLAPGAATWQALGTLPGPEYAQGLMVYAVVPAGGGVLWAIPPTPNAADPILSATYP